MKFLSMDCQTFAVRYRERLLVGFNNLLMETVFLWVALIGVFMSTPERVVSDPTSAVLLTGALLGLWGLLVQRHGLRTFDKLIARPRKVSDRSFSRVVCLGWLTSQRLGGTLATRGLVFIVGGSLCVPVNPIVGTLLVAWATGLLYQAFRQLHVVERLIGGSKSGEMDTKRWSVLLKG